jgi:hypothetical protein
MLRVIIINYTDSAIGCDVVFPAQETIAFLRCSKTGDPSTPDILIAKASSPYTLTVPAGGMCGFAAAQTASVTSPAPTKVSVITAGGAGIQ